MFAKNANRNQFNHFIIGGASICVIFACLYLAKGVLGPLLMATFFSVILLPFLRWLRKKGLSEGLSLIIVILAVLLIWGAVTTVMVASLKDFVNNIPNYQQKLTEKFAQIDLLKNIQLLPVEKTEKKSDQEPEKETEQSDTDVNLPLPKDKNFLNRQMENNYFSNLTEKPFLAIIAPQTQNNLANNNLASVSGQTEIFKNSMDPTNNENFTNSENSINIKNPINSEDLANTNNPILSEISIINKEAQNTGNSENVRDSESPYSALLDSTQEEQQPEILDQTSLGNNHSEIIYSEQKSSKQGESGQINPRTDTTPEHNFHISGKKEQFQQMIASADQVQKDSSQEDFWGHPETAVQTGTQLLFMFFSDWAKEVSSFLGKTFIVLLLVIFMLIEATQLPDKILAAFGKKDIVNEHLKKIADDIRRYMLIKALVSLCVGGTVTVFLILMQVNYAVFWGIIAFFLNFIPNIGSTVAAVPPIILATVDSGIGSGMIVSLGMIAINCGYGYILEPKLLGRGLGLSPLVVLLSLVFWSWILGAVGLFLSPPLTVILKIILQSFPETRWLSVLMADKIPSETSMFEQSGDN